MKVAIVGSGITGLALGYDFIELGADVTIFEGSKELGGLVSSVDVAGVPIEKYYHHLFVNQHDIIALKKLAQDAGRPAVQKAAVGALKALDAPSADANK